MRYLVAALLLTTVICAGLHAYIKYDKDYGFYAAGRPRFMTGCPTCGKTVRELDRPSHFCPYCKHELPKTYWDVSAEEIRRIHALEQKAKPAEE